MTGELEKNLPRLTSSFITVLVFTYWKVLTDVFYKIRIVVLLHYVNKEVVKIR